jgi:hypothetical protein
MCPKSFENVFKSFDNFENVSKILKSFPKKFEKCSKLKK